MFNLTTLQNSKYCDCGNLLFKDLANEYCNSCNRTNKNCVKCDRSVSACYLKRGLCWDCLHDEQRVPNENLKCNFCGKYSSTPLCWTCEKRESSKSSPSSGSRHRICEDEHIINESIRCDVCATYSLTPICQSCKNNESSKSNHHNKSTSRSVLMALRNLVIFIYAICMLIMIYKLCICPPPFYG